MRMVLCVAIAWCATCVWPLQADESPAVFVAASRKIDFVADVQPIFRATCYSCHGAEAQEAGLRLDIKGRALAGGDGGKSILPGDSGHSRLLALVTGEDTEVGRMPPEGEGTPLSPEQVATLRAWIDQGASWPDSADTNPSRSSHWSFQPLTRAVPPAVRAASATIHPIDAFVWQRLEAEGLQPARPAPRETLLRRVYLDLIGLPPTPEELVEFLQDTRPDAYERLVERLLASPHYGERWGRHWLDLARYADSDGYEKDRVRPFAWRYRNWVIDAINADLPYDHFSLDQIAGDMIPDAALEQQVASGFHRNTLHNTEGGADPEEDRVKKTVDRTNTVGAIWLGLTVGCAQCHSHKYDPLTQREYFQLYAFFNSINEVDVAAPLPVDQEWGRLNKLVDQPAKNAPKADEVKAQAVVQLTPLRPAAIHIRGDFLNPGDSVQAGTPTVLPELPASEAQPNRLDFARWLFDRDNPLTARVTVNRMWQRIFGRGIVNTVDDFGLQGELPSHPELLDWLASEFRDGGWSIKEILRAIVTSATYRQAAEVRADLSETDPENVWLARYPRRRVEAETIRDVALAASGLLDTKIGGPSVRPPQPAEYSGLTYANSAKWQTSSGGDAYRRGLYTFFQRTSPYPMLMVFDSPDSTETCAQRSSSNTPLQALTLWNDPAFHECAQALGARVVHAIPSSADPGQTTRERAQYAFALTLSRPAAAAELNDVIALYQAQAEWLAREADSASRIVGKQVAPPGVTTAELANWIVIGRTLINLDEFITRD